MTTKVKQAAADPVPQPNKPTKKRPLKKGYAQKALALNLANGQTITDACAAVDVSRFTFYEWKKRDDKFRKIIDKIKESRVSIVEDALYDTALKNNVAAQVFYLCNRSPERWKNIQRVENSIPNDQIDKIYDKLAKLLK